MVKKRKLRYKNFNICQLVDKGKLKLQYLDEFKESKKIHGKITKQIEHVDKKHKIEKVLDLCEQNKLLVCDKTFDSLVSLFVFENITYDFLVKSCNFIEIKNKTTDDTYSAILVMRDYGLITDDKLLKNDLEFITEEIEPYLISFDMVKKEYSIEELKEIFYKYLESKQNIDKKLIK